jgi:hypothetical protein
MLANRTKRDWFQEAERCYVEKHQGCAWCGDSHQVFKFRQGKQVIYYCNACDFRISYDSETNAYASIPGETTAKTQKKTMFEFQRS